MSLRYMQRLVDELEGSKQFPPPREYFYRKKIELFVAIRESDGDALRPEWWFQEYESNREYVVDPLGERIGEVWADMLFGEEADFEPAIKGDMDNLTRLIDDNDLPATLPWAEELCASEGEVWSRLVSIPDISSAQMEWHSRLNVIPLFIGRKLVAAAVYSVLEMDEDAKKEWVYVEYHCEGYSANRLYFHTPGHGLGNPVPLTDRMETEMLRPEWNHGLPMLVDRIHNKLGRDWHCGISALNGVAGLLLSLNEITNIGQENARLTAKQKVVIPERYLDAKGRLPRGAEIIIASQVDQDPDKIKNDFAMIEWEFDADAIIKYKADLTDIILTRARVAPQLVGRHTETAQTGPALRARLVDTILATGTKGKVWDDKLPEKIALAAQLEDLPLLRGGAGHSWNNPKKEPTFKRRSPLPEDEESRSRRVVTEVNAKVKSKKTAIAELNPTWGDQRVEDELTLLSKEQEDALKQQQKQFEQQGGGGPPGQKSNGQPADPASPTNRSPGARKPSTVPNPTKIVRT
jgi:hypothetical protein